MLPSKASVCNTVRLIKTLVAGQVIKESVNSLGFEAWFGQFSEEGYSEKRWTHNSGSSRQIVLQLFVSTLLTKWLFRLTYASLGASIFQVFCS